MNEENRYIAAIYVFAIGIMLMSFGWFLEKNNIICNIGMVLIFLVAVWYWIEIVIVTKKRKKNSK